MFMLTLLFIALTFLALGGGAGGQTFARVTAVVLAVFVSADELGVTLGYLDAAAVSRETTNELAHTDLSDLLTALSIFVDYSTATASAPPIPTPIYERKHDEIERLWQTADIRIHPTQSGEPRLPKDE
jgi:hypothetical protein